MITVTVVSGEQEVKLSYNQNDYYFPITTSKADYTSKGDTLILQCPPIGLSIPFSSASYQFIINSVVWAGTFEALATEFNDNLFSSTNISPPPGEPLAIRASAITTGAYVATTSFQATGRSQVNLDFTLGGAPANSGCIVGIVQVSDNGTDWLNIDNLVAGTTLVADGAASPFQAGTVFRQYSAEYSAIVIPYVTGNLPTLPIRISYATGYGKYYRLQVRASDVAGISSGAPATFPTLAITATLQ